MVRGQTAGRGEEAGGCALVQAKVSNTKRPALGAGLGGAPPRGGRGDAAPAGPPSAIIGATPNLRVASCCRTRGLPHYTERLPSPPSASISSNDGEWSRN